MVRNKKSLNQLATENLEFDDPTIPADDFVAPAVQDESTNVLNVDEENIEEVQENKFIENEKVEAFAPAIHLQPEVGTWKHLVKQELDEEPEVVESGVTVVRINGAFRKEIRNGDREILVFPGSYVRELEKLGERFDGKLNSILREHGFLRCQVVNNQVLQPSPFNKDEYWVVKAR